MLFALIVSSAVSSSRAQAIGAHRGDTAGTGGSSSIQGHIVSPTGRMPESRVRITLEHTDTGTRTAFAGDEGSFNFSRAGARLDQRTALQVAEVERARPTRRATAPRARTSERV
jgi:hypothetical protein